MKSEFRRFFLKLRRETDEKYIQAMSAKISSKIRESSLYKNSQNIFVYVSTNKEVDTKDFIKKALDDGKEIYVPKIVDKEMLAARITDFDELIGGAYDIPTSSREEYIKNPDLSLVPGLSFDKKKNRLGYGGGYYDRFLASNKTVKMGLMLSDFISNQLPAEKHDVKMDYVVSENEIF